MARENFPLKKGDFFTGHPIQSKLVGWPVIYKRFLRSQ